MKNKFFQKIIKDVKYNLKSEKGSISIFVLAAMIFMTTILAISYIGINNKQIAQEKEIQRIQEEYSAKDSMQQEKQMEEAYKKAIKNLEI